MLKDPRKRVYIGMDTGVFGSLVRGIDAKRTGKTGAKRVVLGRHCECHPVVGIRAANTPVVVSYRRGKEDGSESGCPLTRIETR